jgi:methionine-S-sulfoxide reductase
MKEIYFAGGCFWGTEHFFKQIDGVVKTEVGFANGNTENPSYREVYTDQTGHAETVHVVYDENIASLEFLLNMFFKAIDPVSLNRQGHDEGTRYRTGVYYTDEAQLATIDRVFAQQQALLSEPLAVERMPLKCFFRAEDEHQDYLEKNPTGYCHLPTALFEMARKARPKATATKLLAVLLLCLPGLTSCIKDEAPNTECDITAAWVEGAQYEGLFYQPSQMRQDNISSAEENIVFTVKTLHNLPERLPVDFRLTPGATIVPASGSEQDFKNGPVGYTVTSEDGQWQRHYSVQFKESATLYKFSFEHVDTVLGTGNNYYHSFYEADDAGNRHDIWASGNPGAIIIKSNTRAEQQPTYSMANGYRGRGVCLNTQSAGQWGKTFGKPIAAGNLFMGRFIVEKVLMDALKATEFGTPAERVPMRVAGYYKYKPGEVFTNKQMQAVPGRTDEASIYAVFYRNKDEQGNDVHLYGDDVQTSPYILKKAQVASLPATSEWTRFEMNFEGPDADPEVLAQQGYSLTLVFSSSKEGATFEGAIGSELCIDEVEMWFENPDNNDKKEE